MKRSIKKGLRDLLVFTVGTSLLALAERAGDFGIPAEAVPAVGAAAMFMYRSWRDRWGTNIDPV